MYLCVSLFVLFFTPAQAVPIQGPDLGFGLTPSLYSFLSSALNAPDAPITIATNNAVVPDSNYWLTGINPPSFLPGGIADDGLFEASKFTLPKSCVGAQKEPLPENMIPNCEEGCEMCSSDVDCSEADLCPNLDKQDQIVGWWLCPQNTGYCYPVTSDNTPGFDDATKAFVQQQKQPNPSRK